MKFKRIIVVFLLLCIAISMTGCIEEVTIDGVCYKKVNGSCNVTFISTRNIENIPKSIYVSDEVDGTPVESLGWIASFSPGTRIFVKEAKKIYFPWSIKTDFGLEINLPTSVEYFIFCSSPTFRYNRPEYKYVIPNSIYIDAYQQEILPSCYIPANISYFFNYDNCPNDNYFFIDIVEESGKLTKPPYDPKREGYTFAGWYKDEACTEIFDFDNDIVEIKFDEEGNRIYEEICLYAGWEKEPTTWEKITDWFKSLFN